VLEALDVDPELELVDAASEPLADAEVLAAVDAVALVLLADPVAVLLLAAVLADAVAVLLLADAEVLPALELELELVTAVPSQTPAFERHPQVDDSSEQVKPEGQELWSVVQSGPQNSLVPPVSFKQWPPLHWLVAVQASQVAPPEAEPEELPLAVEPEPLVEPETVVDAARLPVDELALPVVAEVLDAPEPLVEAALLAWEPVDPEELAWLVLEWLPEPEVPVLEVGDDPPLDEPLVPLPGVPELAPEKTPVVALPLLPDPELTVGEPHPTITSALSPAKAMRRMGTSKARA
jgi:hypothetical protein